MRTLSLVVFTFTFLLIGAAVFDALESERDEQSQVMLESESVNVDVVFLSRTAKKLPFATLGALG